MTIGPSVLSKTEMKCSAAFFDSCVYPPLFGGLAAAGLAFRIVNVHPEMTQQFQYGHTGFREKRINQACSEQLNSHETTS